MRTGSRRKGLARAAARRRGRAGRAGTAHAPIEAYPVDSTVQKPSSSELYHGPLSVFLRAGFTEVGGRPEAGATVRLVLAP